ASGYICRVVLSGSFYVQGIVWNPAQQGLSYALPSLPSVNNWYHVACTYGSGSLILYWNGSQVASLATGAGALADSADALAIGKAWGGGEDLHGRIAEHKMCASSHTS